MIRVDEDDPVGELEPSFADREVTIKRGVDAEDFYEFLTEIGRGKFGTVYCCREKATGLELAAKCVSVGRREDRRNVEREVDIMRQLRHPRLIQLYEAFDTGKVMCVVLELIKGGELFERVIDDDFVLTEKSCTVFMRQICEGIEFVHQQNILHLDMKPENILCLTKSGNRIKIIDFGLARKFDPSKKLQVLFGTPEFVAPEVVNFDQIGFGTDMWSVGVICYVLLSGLSPFMGETDVETMANVTIAKYDFDDEAFNEISEDAKDFIKKLLVKDKQSRMTAQQCIAHRWLQKRPSPEKKPHPTFQETIIVEPKKPPEALDVTKDNLRLFVERWSEHPNSPYLFDVTTHEITPCVSLTNCIERSPSQQSLGGCSPSPCGSINSSPDSIIESDQVFYRNDNDSGSNQAERRPSYNSFHSLERRASDSSCFIHKKADVSLRVNLAEEIKKLSDRLFMLSTINTDLINSNFENKDSSSSQEVNSVTQKIPNGILTTKTATSSSVSNSGPQKSSSSSFAKTTVTKTSNNDSMKQTTCVNESKTVNQNTNSYTNHSANNNSTTEHKSQAESSNNISATSNGKIKSSSSTSQLSFEQSINSSENDGGIFGNLPWNRKKFKITNSSRDVPLSPIEKTKSLFGIEFNKRREKIDGFANQNANGESPASSNGRHRHFYKKTDENGDVQSNANNTKDLLLHLLDQWDDIQTPPNDFHSGRHKSVSMEWSENEKVASKSMSTINTFFRKQSSVSSGVRKKQEALASNGYK